VENIGEMQGRCSTIKETEVTNNEELWRGKWGIMRRSLNSSTKSLHTQCYEELWRENFRSNNCRKNPENSHSQV